MPTWVRGAATRENKDTGDGREAGGDETACGSYARAGDDRRMRDNEQGVHWEGGGYSYIRVLPDEFLLKSVVITVDFKGNSSGRTRIYEYPPPPPINALVTVLRMRE